MPERKVTGVMRSPKSFDTVKFAVVYNRDVFTISKDGLIEGADPKVITPEHAVDMLAELGELSKVEWFVDEYGFNVVRGFVTKDGIQHCFYIVYDVLYKWLVKAQMAAIRNTVKVEIT